MDAVVAGLVAWAIVLIVLGATFLGIIIGYLDDN